MLKLLVQVTVQMEGLHISNGNAEAGPTTLGPAKKDAPIQNALPVREWHIMPTYMREETMPPVR